MSPVSPGEWYSYAIVRIVPRVERDEFANAGVILFVRANRTLLARISHDLDRIRQLAPDADVLAIAAHLQLFEAISQAAPEGGPISELPADERFHWLTAPRSTVIQVSPVHEGSTADPQATLSELFERYVGHP